MASNLYINSKKVHGELKIPGKEVKGILQKRTKFVPYGTSLRINSIL